MPRVTDPWRVGVADQLGPRITAWLGAHEHRVGLVLVVGAGAIARALAWNPNGPHSDESAYVIAAARFGNASFVSGEVNLWPRLAALADALGGLAAVRGLAAVLLAGLLLVAGLPQLLVGNQGTHDALAFALFAGGCWQLVVGVERNRTRALVAAAVALGLAAQARYFLLACLPVPAAFALIDGVGRGRRLLLRFFLPLGLIVGGYALLNRAHLLGARAEVAHNLATFVWEQSPGRVVATVGTLAAPIVAALLAGLVGLWRCGGARAEPRDPERTRLVLLLLGGFAWVPLLQLLWLRSAYGLPKNLVVSAAFGAILGGIGLAALASRIWRAGRGWRRAAASAVVVGLAGGAALAHALGRLPTHEVWPDWRPVVVAARPYVDSTSGPIWSTASNSRWGNVHQLAAEFGARVDPTSPWRAAEPRGVLALAAEVAAAARGDPRQVPLVIGPYVSLHERLPQLPPGARLGSYEVRERIPIRDGPEVYVFVHRPADPP